MNPVFDAFWRAAAYCLHPRVILWSLLPLVVAVGVVLGLGWAYWEMAVAAVRATLEQWSLMAATLHWLESVGAGGLRAVIAPLLVVAMALPLIVIGSLLLVAWLMTPALVGLVAQRRFPELERRGSAAAWWQGVAWSLGCTLVALIVLGFSLPLWFVPPLALIVPPLVWGWLASRVFGFDVLSAHASVGERRLLLHSERWPMLLMGVAVGLLGAAPSLVWAAGAITLIFAPLLVVVSVWLYTLVFAFAALWFAHFALARLARLRALPDANASMTPPPPSSLSPPSSPLLENPESPPP